MNSTNWENLDQWENSSPLTGRLFGRLFKEEEEEVWRAATATIQSQEGNVSGAFFVFSFNKNHGVNGARDLLIVPFAARWKNQMPRLHWANCFASEPGEIVHRRDAAGVELWLPRDGQEVN